MKAAESSQQAPIPSALMKRLYLLHLTLLLLNNLVQQSLEAVLQEKKRERDKQDLFQVNVPISSSLLHARLSG